MRNTEKPNAKAPNSSKRGSREAAPKPAKPILYPTPAFKQGQLTAAGEGMYEVVRGVHLLAEQYDKDGHKLMLDFMLSLLMTDSYSTMPDRSLAFFISLVSVYETALANKAELEQIVWDSTIYYEID